MQSGVEAYDSGGTGVERLDADSAEPLRGDAPASTWQVALCCHSHHRGATLPCDARCLLYHFVKPSLEAAQTFCWLHVA